MSSRWPAGRAGIWASLGVGALLVLTTADLGQHYQLPIGAAFALGVMRALALALVWLRPPWALPVSLATSVLTATVCVPVSLDEAWPWPVTGVFGHSLVLALAGARGATDLAIGGDRDSTRRGSTRWASPRWMLAGWWVVTQLVGVVGMALAPERGSWAGLLTMALLSAVAVVVADLVRSRADARQRLVEQEEISAAERAQRARWQERARIARELHDVVAHHLSVVVVRADSAPHRLNGLADDAREEFAGIAEDARSSLTEMRRVLRLLREDPSSARTNSGRANTELGPQPGLAGLAELVAGTRRAGADVRLEIQPASDLDPAVELTAYRVVQEAISNAVRHAPGTVVDVSVRRVDGELIVSVVNGPMTDGLGATVAPGSGHGLVGMRERVSLLDGRVHTAPTADGGYRVEVALPLDEDSVDGVSPSGGDRGLSRLGGESGLGGSASASSLEDGVGEGELG